MFYRRKVILSIIESLNNTVEKIALQKLLFLFCIRQKKPDYDFIPYHYGCYSFSANADLIAMIKHELITDDVKSFIKKDRVNYSSKLNESDKKILSEIIDNYGKMNSNSLMKHTYLNHKYYAINSKTAKDILSDAQYKTVVDSKPKSNETILFTIGYEKISLEEYLNKLIKNDIKLLVDVRNNPLSMKFGFSQIQLKKYCESVGIKYIHFPEVGIQSEYRQNLETQEDYNKLFKLYSDHVLCNTINYQKNILDLLITNKRIALTCFEANINQCHRKHLAESIESLPKWNYIIKHI